MSSRGTSPRVTFLGRTVPVVGVTLDPVLNTSDTHLPADHKDWTSPPVERLGRGRGDETLLGRWACETLRQCLSSTSSSLTFIRLFCPGPSLQERETQRLSS